MRLYDYEIDDKHIVNKILTFIIIKNPKILNIAGNRESVCNGIGDKVYKIMNEVFKQLNNLK
jgi:hypothetical protein